MSRYYVNRFMRDVHFSSEELTSYVNDPAGYVPRWVERVREGRRDVLTADEHAALAARDYGALYALGAHPFLLWSFTEAVWIGELPRPEIVERFRRAAEGYPDFST